MIKLLEILREAKQSIEDFASTRLKGAEKIADTTQAAGGLSLLTYKHYKVKLPYYKKAAAGKLNKDAAKKEFEKTLSSISLGMTQSQFQTEVGRLEVLGELLIENKK
jgi:tRNA(Ile2) C34 agmatinyltransferase TiaS